jgi:hypothetical protein
MLLASPDSHRVEDIHVSIAVVDDKKQRKNKSFWHSKDSADFDLVSTSEDAKNHHICTVAYLWMIVAITVATITATAESTFKFFIFAMLASTPMVFVLYVCYVVKAVKDTKIGYLVMGTDSLEDVWEIFLNLSSAQVCMWACMWLIIICLVKTCLLQPALNNLLLSKHTVSSISVSGAALMGTHATPWPCIPFYYILL